MFQVGELYQAVLPLYHDIPLTASLGRELVECRFWGDEMEVSEGSLFVVIKVKRLLKMNRTLVQFRRRGELFFLVLTPWAYSLRSLKKMC